VNRQDDNTPEISGKLDALLAAMPVQARSAFTARVLEQIRKDAELQAHETCLDTLLQAQPIAVPEDFSERTMRCIHRSVRRARRLRRVGMAAAAAAAIALSAALALERVDDSAPADPGLAPVAVSMDHAHESDRVAGRAAVSDEALMYELILLSEALEGAEPLLEDEAFQALALMSR